MRLALKPKYVPITQKNYCCAPACIQMVLGRRGMQYESQEDIGWALGLIVPKKVKHLFHKVRTGKKPKHGYGTRESQKRYSLQNYFKKREIPLQKEFLKLSRIADAEKFIIENLEQNNDMWACFFNQKLFGEGEFGHMCLIQEIDTEKKTVTLIDPSRRESKARAVKLARLLEAIKYHEDYSKGAGFVLITGN